MTAPNFNSNFKSFVIIKTPLRLAQHSGQHSGPCGGMLVFLSQHTHPAVLGSWLYETNTALGSDGQGPQGLSFVFSIFLDFCLRFQIFLLT